jgi:hypothetical protein
VLSVFGSGGERELEPGITIDDCIAIWNGPGNADVRAATRPPDGPTGTFFAPVGGPDTLKGGDAYRVFVGIAIGRVTINATEPPPPGCFVYFYYPGGEERPLSMLTIRTSDDCRSYKLEQASLYNTEPNTSVTHLPEAVQAPDGSFSLKTRSVG